MSWVQIEDTCNADKIAVFSGENTVLYFIKWQKRGKLNRKKSAPGEYCGRESSALVFLLVPVLMTAEGPQSHCRSAGFGQKEQWPFRAKGLISVLGLLFMERQVAVTLWCLLGLFLELSPCFFWSRTYWSWVRNAGLGWTGILFSVGWP
jgi:hypothetical protein